MSSVVKNWFKNFEFSHQEWRVLIKRIVTAVVLIPIVLLLVLRAPVAVVAVVTGAVALLTIHEFLKLVEAYGVQPLRKPTYGAVLLFFLLLVVNAGRENHCSPPRFSESQPPSRLPSSLSYF